MRYLGILLAVSLIACENPDQDFFEEEIFETDSLTDSEDLDYETLEEDTETDLEEMEMIEVDFPEHNKSVLETYEEGDCSGHSSIDSEQILTDRDNKLPLMETIVAPGKRYLTVKISNQSAIALIPEHITDYYNPLWVSVDGKFHVADSYERINKLVIVISISDSNFSQYDNNNFRKPKDCETLINWVAETATNLKSRRLTKDLGDGFLFDLDWNVAGYSLDGWLIHLDELFPY